MLRKLLFESITYELDLIKLLHNNHFISYQKTTTNNNNNNKIYKIDQFMTSLVV